MWDDWADPINLPDKREGGTNLRQGYGMASRSVPPTIE